MAKKTRKIQSKYIHTAISMRKTRRQHGIVALVALIAAVGIFAICYMLVSNAILSLAGPQSWFVWLFFAILAAVVGIYTNRYSRANTEYRRYLREHGITENDIKEYLQTHRI